MKRIKLIALAVAALAVSLSCAPKKAASAAAGSDAKAAPASVIELVFFEGDVRVDGKAAEIGMKLAGKASIETGASASCDLVFDIKNAIRIGQNTVATLDLASAQKAVSIQKGGFSAVLRKLAKIAGEDSFRVTSDAATAAVRGTSFCVWVDGASTYVCACNGSVSTLDSAGANELNLAAAHHTARVYQKKGASMLVTPAGVEHHSDSSIESLAARIGEKVDWTKADR